MAYPTYLHFEPTVLLSSTMLPSWEHIAYPVTPEGMARLLACSFLPK
jgi:hypothetical protein